MERRPWDRLGRVFLRSCVALVPVVCAGSCDIDLGGTVDQASDDTIDAPVVRVVTVRFRNLSSLDAVDVEFHVSDTPPMILPDDLFDPLLQVSSNIGVAGTGLLQPFQDDVVEIPCAVGLTLGTRGGSFVDNETGEPRGVGVPRWVQEGPLSLCGGVVTFEFTGSDGSFDTTISITR